MVSIPRLRHNGDTGEVYDGTVPLGKETILQILLDKALGAHATRKGEGMHMMNGNDYLKQMVRQTQREKRKKEDSNPMALFKTLAIMAGIMVVLFLAEESGRFGW